jgi:quinol monooxygenase YgiN
MDLRFITTLEGRVPQEKQAELTELFNSLAKPTGMIESFLMQNGKDPELTRAFSIWENREAFEAMRSSQTSPILLAFRKVGVEPTILFFTIAAVK